MMMMINNDLCVNRFPHNTNQVLILSVEESMKISCPNATDAISGIFLVNETGFNTCSAAEANRYSVTKYTSVVQDAPPFDEHLFTCVGFDTSITFSFNSNSKGRIFYLIGQLALLVTWVVGV